MRMIVACESEATAGTWSRAKARKRSSRPMASTPRSRSRSANRTDAPSPSHQIRAVAVGLERHHENTPCGRLSVGAGRQRADERQQEHGCRSRQPYRSPHGDTSRPAISGRPLLPNVTVSAQRDSPAPRHWTTSTVPGELEQRQDAFERRSVVAAERHVHGLTHATEDGTAQVDARLVLPDLHEGATARVGLTDEPSSHAQREAGAERSRQCTNPARSKITHSKDGRLRGVVAGPFGHGRVHAIFGAGRKLSTAASGARPMVPSRRPMGLNQFS